MKRIKSISGLITVISLLLGVIWLNPALAAAPIFESLGNIQIKDMATPRAMDMDSSGNLFVADVSSGDVFKFDKYGVLRDRFEAGGNGLGVAVSGNLLYVSRDAAVVVFDLVTGEEAGFLSGANPGGAEFDMAGYMDIDAAGNVFVADINNDVVKVYTAEGIHLATIGGPGVANGTFADINGLSLSPSGQLVVADGSAANAKVHVFTLNSDYSVFAVNGYSKGSSIFGAELSTPRGIDFDEQGRGYFLEYINSRISVVSETFTASLGLYDKPGKRVGQLYSVNDVVYDAIHKRLFVSCGVGRVEIIGVDGGSSPQAVNHPPTTPEPYTPFSGSFVTSASPTLEFKNSFDEDGDTLSYHVVVSQGGTVVSQVTVAGQVGLTTSVALSESLTEHASYSWTVQANDGEKLSGVSSPSNFTVDAIEQAPDAPELLAPFGGTRIDGQAVFEWTESSDPDPGDVVTGYLVEISPDSDFSSSVTSETVAGTSLELNAFADYATLIDGTSYFWRVSAQVGDTETSEPSAVDSFVYDTTVLTISANMPGAKVSLHGNHAYAGQALAGFAPIELRDFTPGIMSVVVERSGFEPFVAQVNLAKGDNVDLYAELVPAMVVDKLSASRNGINGRSGLSVAGSAAPFLVDFDNDGDLDLLVGNGTLTLFKNMQMAGRNRLYFDQGESLGVAGTVPFVADWNNDGKKDLIVGQTGGAVMLFTNTGSEEAPAFDSGKELVVPTGSASAPAVLDFDGDGRKDLLIGDASGQVAVFFNEGTDAAPLFAAVGVVQEGLAANGAVVPFPVDWDADGQPELLISSGGVVTVYVQVDGKYQPGVQFDARRDNYVAAFPIDLDGSGKQLLVGQNDGQIVYLTGNSTVPVASFHLALQEKVAELAGLVDTTLSGDVSAIQALVDAGDYVAAADATAALVSVLPAGDALQSAIELQALLSY